MSIYACHCCFDWRENHFLDQHGLRRSNGFFPSRNEGGFQPKTLPMLVGLGRAPAYVVQGHQDCVGVGTLFASHGKAASALTDYERLYRTSHGEALELVKTMAGHLEPPRQRQVLEMTCVAQSVNNFLKSASPGTDYAPGCYAYFSFPPVLTLEQSLHPETVAMPPPDEIPLAVFDPLRETFVMGAAANSGIRLADITDPQGGMMRERLKIVRPIELKEVIKNTVRFLDVKEKPAFQPTRASLTAGAGPGSVVIFPKPR